jgi:U4/U6 small nuclear ribonucleoprotein PRP3
VAVTKSSNPYLAHRGAPPDDDGGDELDVVDATIDPALVDAVGRQRKPRKELTFVEPGKYQQLAEVKREREARAAAAGFLSGRKQGHTLTAISMGSVVVDNNNDISMADDSAMDSTILIVPRADAHPETKMPVAVEWWDTDLLPLHLREQVAAEENKLLLKQSKAAVLKVEIVGGGDNDGTKDGSSEDSSLEALRIRCYAEALLENSRTSALVQHIVPVRKISKQRKPVLHLTKKELKRQRKLRRQEKQQQFQDLQAAGLVPAPEPRLTLSNFIKVLGDQAFLDPSQMERKVQEQMEARQRAHLNRNASDKLTKEQRNAKLARKYQTDSATTTIETCIFFVRDVSHNYHRAKIDTNAQQFCLTGCVLEVPDQYACVIVEGSPKAIQKFSRLLLVRMQWNGEDFPKDNGCEKVWQGIVPKRTFKGFLFQTAESADQARKILKTKGVEHYWNLTADHASGKMSGIRLKLVVVDDDEATEDNPFQVDTAGDNDIIME